MNELNFLQLKKAAKKVETAPELKIILMGDCATQHLATAIRGCFAVNNIGAQVVDVDYNLIDAQVLDEQSELYEENPDFVLLFMCSEKLEEAFSICAEKTAFAEQMCKKIRGYWERINTQLKANILQFTFVERENYVFGNYSLKTQESFLFQVKKLNYLLAAETQSVKNAFLIDLNNIRAEIGEKHFKDEKLYYAAKMPVTTEALPLVAKSVFTTVMAIRGRVKKCVICDLDNTLWGGVIGDDGLSGIQIGELGVGHAFEDLQRWLKNLKERGIILCICSKNNEEAAREPFEKHPEMILRLEDISVFVANWDDKASNIVNIQKTLNIGMDSIVFLDDNPFERNLVRSIVPDITVPELPEDPSEYLTYLQSLNLFETASFSEGDKNRTEQYQSEMKRLNAEKSFTSYDDYLISLEMIAETKPFDEFQTPRIAQLTQRSNQFNLRTVRCTEKDIADFASNPDYITRYFMLRDKFGDHGLISVLLLKKQDSHTLFIENWLMSCRVLKRGMEEYIINSIVSIAKEYGFDTIVGEYLPTAKNSMVSDIYAMHGFESVGEGKFILKVNQYEAQKTFIN